jgi:pyruvate carboxylase subunit B
VKYTVSLGGRDYVVDLTGHRVVMDGREVAAELHAVPGTPLRQLVLSDASVTFTMTRVDGGWEIGHHGEPLRVQVVDERTRLLREMTGQGIAAAGDQVITAPMPGLVLRVDVATDDAVVAGAPLLVLEAMKMENEIRAHAAGIVRAIHVTAGQAVERGAPLLEIAAGEG